ncbi:putative N-acetyltransferase camello [Vespula squamosa]|uniref:N-acetyltransferase camello n=1 Tax=Vespula squamosa TaxID=30214 RepID=A0ABD2C6F0_VESSQ
MNCFIVFRSYKQEDEPRCKKLLKNGVMSLINPTYNEILVRGITFEIPIFMIIIILILFGIPLIHFLLVIPIVAITVYITLYTKFLNKANEIQKEVSNIPRIYMSSNSSCFWVAEAYEKSSLNYPQQDQEYILMTEEQFNYSNIDVSLYIKKIVGTIALCKSNRIQNSAWIKRLYVHKNYRKKSIGSFLLNIALEFSILQGYNRVNVVISEYRKDAKKLFIKKGFELYLCYKKSVFKSLITMLIYELTYQINYYINENFTVIDPYYAYYILDS